jgi:hypothetical protein
MSGATRERPATTSANRRASTNRAILYVGKIAAEIRNALKIFVTV